MKMLDGNERVPFGLWVQRNRGCNKVTGRWSSSRCKGDNVPTRVAVVWHLAWYVLSKIRGRCCSSTASARTHTHATVKQRDRVRIVCQTWLRSESYSATAATAEPSADNSYSGILYTLRSSNDRHPISNQQSATDAVRCGAVRCGTMPCDAVRCDALRSIRERERAAKQALCQVVSESCPAWQAVVLCLLPERRALCFLSGCSCLVARTLVAPAGSLARWTLVWCHHCQVVRPRRGSREQGQAHGNCCGCAALVRPFARSRQFNRLALPPRQDDTRLNVER